MNGSGHTLGGTMLWCNGVSFGMVLALLGCPRLVTGLSQACHNDVKAHPLHATDCVVVSAARMSAFLWSSDLDVSSAEGRFVLGLTYLSLA